MYTHCGPASHVATSTNRSTPAAAQLRIAPHLGEFLVQKNAYPLAPREENVQQPLAFLLVQSAAMKHPRPQKDILVDELEGSEALSCDRVSPCDS